MSLPPDENGRLEAIWIKRGRGGPMDDVRDATLVAGRGIAGNANQGGRRQVTLIEREVWERLMRELGADADPSTRRANLLLSSITLRDSRGRVLRVGSVRIRIFGETRPCRQMDEALAGLRAALRPDWGGGAFGEVLDSGRIEVGDSARWVK